MTPGDAAFEIRLHASETLKAVHGARRVIAKRRAQSGKEDHPFNSGALGSAVDESAYRALRIAHLADRLERWLRAHDVTPLIDLSEDLEDAIPPYSGDAKEVAPC